jgi:hypothetical protein
MKSELFPAGIPRLNHVAMSLPADALDASGRAEILEFYGDCFGWQELPTETVDRTKMVLAVGHWDQFVFLHAEDQPMRTPRLDHFGVSVYSRDDLDAAWARVARWAERDDRVDVIEPKIDDFDVLKIHAFYVRHLLPMMVEVQFWEFP